MAETLRPDPLTPEPYDAAALDYWREQLTRDYSEKWDDADVLFVVGRFLATIAALRAATPDPAEPGLRDVLKVVWKDGHRAGIGCGHDLAVCRHDDYEVAVEISDLASWNAGVLAALTPDETA